MPWQDSLGPDYQNAVLSNNELVARAIAAVEAAFASDDDASLTSNVFLGMEPVSKSAGGKCANDTCTGLLKWEDGTDFDKEEVRGSGGKCHRKGHFGEIWMDRIDEDFKLVPFPPIVVFPNHW